ncbi:MAG: zinc-binding dehydrogenase [Acidimicrobiales bacterium]
MCSTSEMDLVRSIGADRVLDYIRDDFADGTRRHDLILDIGWSSPLSRLRAALTATGTLVIVGGEECGRWFGGIGRQLRASIISPFVSLRLTAFTSKERHEDLESLAVLIEAGRVRGKVVLSVGR